MSHHSPQWRNEERLFVPIATKWLASGTDGDDDDEEQEEEEEEEEEEEDFCAKSHQELMSL